MAKPSHIRYTQDNVARDELQWEKTKDLFHRALEQPERERSAWLARQTADSTLRGEVESLLASLQKQDAIQANAPNTAPSAAAAFIPTAQFGAYRAVSLLAQGGMSSVYRAVRADGTFDQVVALKVMAAFLGAPEFLRRFDTERQFLAGLNHHHITRLLDGGVSSTGDPFLVTEFVEGENIDRYCDRLKLNIAARLRIFLQVCDAVAYAHGNLIIHRDLKPGNILVNTEGVVKLLDFGTATLLAVEGDATLTRTRTLTPRYASPEQLRGERVNVATDVFSLGVILYELLVGAWPFGVPGSLFSELNRATGEAPVRSLATAVTGDAASRRSVTKSNLVTTLKGDVAPIVAKALENQPSRRYESVRQLAGDIESVLAGRPVLARPQTLLYRSRMFVRRRWLPVSAAVLFLLGISGATVVALRQAQVARAEARKAQDEARKSARVTAFLRGMLNSGIRVGGSDVTVLQMLSAAEPDIEKSWKDDPLAEATLRSSLGATYVTLEQRDRANLQLKRALELFQSLGRHVDAADTLLVLGINVRAESPKADYYVRSLQELRLAGKEAPPALLFRVKVYRAATLKDFQRIQEAQSLLDEAIAQSGSDPAIAPAMRSAALEIRAETLLEQGRFDEAEAGFRAAIALDPNAFDAWVMLARSRSLQEDASGASALARRDCEMAANGDPEDKAEAVIWWARYRADAGESAEALAQLREVLPAVRKYCQSGHLLARYEQAAAHILNAAGRFEEGGQCARRALDLLREDQMPEIHSLVAASLEDLGVALRGLKRDREALSTLEKSAGLYRRLGPAYSKTLRRVETMAREMAH